MLKTICWIWVLSMGLWVVGRSWSPTGPAVLQHGHKTPRVAFEDVALQDPPVFWRRVHTVQAPSSAFSSATSLPAKAGPASGFMFPGGYGLDTWPGALLMLDIDGDRRDEVIVAAADFPPAGQGSARGVLHVFKAAAGGQLQLWKTHVLPGIPDYAFGGITSGDFNADGHPDAVVGLQNGLAVLTSRGNGDFGIHHEVLNRSMLQLSAMDVDFDGKLDVVGLSWGYITGYDPVRDGPSTAGTIFFGDGAGGVARTQTLATPQRGYNDMKVADANGDGFNDLVITSRQAFHFWVVPHDGRGGFREPVVYPNPSPNGNTNGSVAAADFDADGRVEVAISSFGNSVDSGVWMYKQRSDGALSTPVKMPSLDLAGPMLVADFNNDNLVDLGVIHDGWDQFGIYLQGSNGLTTSEILFEAGSADHYNRQGVAAGRLNDDACPDLVMSEFNYGLVVLLSRNCPATVPRVTGGRLPPRLQ